MQKYSEKKVFLIISFFFVCKNKDEHKKLKEGFT